MAALVLAAFAAVPAMRAHAQQRYRVERIGPEHGLPHTFVYSITQDSVGFLWIGTRDGLCRYDGYSFLIYRPRPFDSLSLSSNSGNTLAADCDGNVWAGTVSYGLNRITRSGERVARYRASGRPGTLPSDAVTVLLADRSGTLWVGTDRGLCRMRRDGAHVTFERIEGIVETLDGERADSVDLLEEAADGAIWAGVNGDYLLRIDPRSGRLDRFSGVSFGRHALTARFVLDDERGAGFVRSNPAALRWIIGRAAEYRDRRTLHLGARFWLNGWQLHPMLLGPGGEIFARLGPYAGGPSGLYLLPAPDGATGQDSALLLVRANVNAMMRDRTGVYWVATESGLFKLVPLNPSITTYRNDPLDDGSIGNNRIRSVHVDRAGTLWVGTDDGLNRLDRGARRWRRYYARPGRAGELSNPTVNVIFEDRDGTMYFGTNNGINRYDRSADRFAQDIGARRTHGSTALEPAAVWSMLRDARGRLWVGTKGAGIYVFDSSGRLVERHRHRQTDSASLSNDRVWCIGADAGGAIWAGTEQGLNRWDASRGRFVRYYNNPRDRNSLAGNNVWALHVDARGDLWAASYGGGLARYSAGRFSSITTADGLPSDAVYGVLSDRRGMLWISSNRGIAVYDPVSRRLLRRLGMGDGLPSDEFSFKAFFAAPDGEMFFGGLAGLARFHPDSLRATDQAARVAITAFRIGDRTISNQLDGDTLSVAYGDDFISLEFAALDFADPAANQYAYMLEGFDSRWIPAGQRRYVSYTNLDPGLYVFRVRGANSSGVWSGDGASLALRVLPPFWMTWWFRWSVAIVVLAGITAAVVTRLRALRRKYSLEGQLAESRLRALRAQMNPHFIFNALNSIQYLVLNNERAEAADYLAKFARLVRMVLEQSERAAVPVSSELEYLNVYLELEALRFDGDLDATVEVERSLIEENPMIPSMLIQPYVENAIRHGLRGRASGRRLRVAIRREDGGIACTIEDNGVGRRRAAAESSGHRSVGMSVTAQRLAILNARRRAHISMRLVDLVDDFGEAAGTRVELFIPSEPGRS